MGSTRSGAARGCAAGAAGQLCLAAGLAFAISLSAGRAAADLPTDGAVGFSYNRSPEVTGCTQATEDEMRDLVRGVLHTDPFVAPGEKAPFSLKVAITLPKPTVVRARFSLFDKDGIGRGVTVVEDKTCDEAQLKLAASIALLLQPRPAPPPAPACPDCPPPTCDAECRAAARKEATDEVRPAVRAEETPRIRAEVLRELEAKFPRRPTVSAVLSAGGLAAFNFAADPAPGFFLAGEARWEHWSLMLEARGLFPTRAYVAADGMTTADLASFSALASPCVRWKFLAGCALAELGSAFVVNPAGAAVASPLVGVGVRTRIDVPIAAGLEVRVFGDGIGHLTQLSLAGSDATGPGMPRQYAFEAPRGFSVFLGVGLARAFE